MDQSDTDSGLRTDHGDLAFLPVVGVMGRSTGCRIRSADFSANPRKHLLRGIGGLTKAVGIRF